MSGPCKGCTDRKLRCHAACDKYAAWKEKNKKPRSYQQDYLVQTFSIDGKMRNLARQHRKTRR